MTSTHPSSLADPRGLSRADHGTFRPAPALFWRAFCFSFLPTSTGADTICLRTAGKCWNDLHKYDRWSALPVFILDGRLTFSWVSARCFFVAMTSDGTATCFGHSAGAVDRHARSPGTNLMRPVRRDCCIFLFGL